MGRYVSRLIACLAMGGVLVAFVACGFGPFDDDDEEWEAATATSSIPSAMTPTRAEATAISSTATRAVAPQPLPRTSEDKWALWVDGVHLRGVDLHPCRLYTVDDCVEPITRQDIQDLRPSSPVTKNLAGDNTEAKRILT